MVTVQRAPQAHGVAAQTGLRKDRREKRTIIMRRCYNVTVAIVYLMSIVSFSDLFTNQIIHVHIHRPRGRRHVFPIRKRRLDDHIQLRFHVYHHNRFHVHATHADIVKM